MTIELDCEDHETPTICCLTFQIGPSTPAHKRSREWISRELHFDMLSSSLRIQFIYVFPFVNGILIRFLFASVVQSVVVESTRELCFFCVPHNISPRSLITFSRLLVESWAHRSRAILLCAIFRFFHWRKKIVKKLKWREREKSGNKIRSLLCSSNS